MLFGVFPFLIATLFATEVVRGEVPVRREIVERFHRRRRLSLIVAAVGIAMLVLGLSQAWAAWTGAVVLAVGIGVGVVASMGFIDGQPDRTGLWVRLSRVHPKFVEALHARGQVPADT